MKKMKDFGSAVQFLKQRFSKVLCCFLFVTLCFDDMQQNRNQNMALPMYGTVLRVLH